MHISVESSYLLPYCCLTRCPTPHHLCSSTSTCSSSDCHQSLKLLQYTSVQQLYILPTVPSDTSVPGTQNISTNSNGEAHYFTYSTSTCTHNHNTTNKERQYVPELKKLLHHLCIHPHIQYILYMMIQTKYMHTRTHTQL